VKPSKIVLALCITLIILVVANEFTWRDISPVRESAQVLDINLTHTFYPVISGESKDARLTVDVTGGRLPNGNHLAIYFRPTSLQDYKGEISFTRKEMKQSANNRDTYEIVLPRRDYGAGYDYYILLEDSTGAVNASFPSQSAGGNLMYSFRFEGENPKPLLLAHTVVMLLGLLFSTLAFMTSLENLDNTDANVRLGKQILWLVIILLVGIFPLGIWLQYQALGIYWNGLPMGRGIANTANLFAFCYWLVILILMKGSAFKSNPPGNIVGPMAVRVLTWLGFVITIGIFLMAYTAGDF